MKSPLSNNASIRPINRGTRTVVELSYQNASGTRKTVALFGLLRLLAAILGQGSLATTMLPTPAELEGARALIARVKAADPSIKRVDEQLVCAAVACQAGEFGGVPTRWRCARQMRDGKDHQKAAAGDRVGHPA